MTTFKTGDVVVVTGPLSLGGELGFVCLTAGEVADVVEDTNSVESFGTIRVKGRHSDIRQWIDISSLTLYSELAETPDVDWGDVHDYVHEGD
jgi:hypothetical protein